MTICQKKNFKNGRRINIARLRKFKVKASQWKLFMIMGVVMMVMGAVGIFILPGIIPFLGFGILAFIIAVWNRDRAIITLKKDHMDMKVAPAAPRKKILYADMKGLDRQSEKKAFLITVQDSKEKKVKLPLGNIEEEERPTLLEELEARMAGEGSEKTNREPEEQKRKH